MSSVRCFCSSSNLSVQQEQTSDSLRKTISQIAPNATTGSMDAFDVSTQNAVTTSNVNKRLRNTNSYTEFNDDYSPTCRNDSDDDEIGSVIKSNEEDDLCLPRSVINKLIKDSAGRIRVSAEARDVLVACCHEFVRILSARANHNCEQHKKKLIGPDHILSALSEMQLGRYRSGCLEVMNVAQEEAAQKRKRISLRCDYDGITADQLRKEQQELFAKARQEHCTFTPEDLAQMQQNANTFLISDSVEVTKYSPEDDYDQPD